VKQLKLQERQSRGTQRACAGKSCKSIFSRAYSFSRYQSKRSATPSAQSFIRCLYCSSMRWKWILRRASHLRLGKNCAPVQ